MSAYQLRPADDQDREDLLRIHLAAMSAHLVAAFGEWSQAQASEHLDAWLRTGRAQVIVVEDVIAGLLDLVWRPEALHIVRIEIDPSFQGRGIGTRIVVDVLAEARQRGIPGRLDVFIANPARRLYERLGFHEIGRDGPSVSMEWQPGRLWATHASRPGPKPDRSSAPIRDHLRLESDDSRSWWGRRGSYMR